MRVFAIIPAAGMGSRMQAGINKQYLRLGDRPILAHTLATFDQHPLIEQIIVVTPEAEIPFCQKQIVEAYNFSCVTAIVAGGAERQDSVRLGLAACQAADDDLVLIHDGVRPFFPPRLLAELIATTEQHGACIVGVPVKDTIKQVTAGMITGTPERSTLWQAQTPQAFRFGLIRAAHQAALADGFRGTDDASLVERLGHPVAIIPGDYRNLKITTPEDLVLARAFLETAGGTVNDPHRPRF